MPEDFRPLDWLVISCFLALGFGLVKFLLSRLLRSEVPLEATSSDRPWYDVLEVSPQADWGEAQQAYGRCVSRYHPDKVSGLGPEFAQLARRRTRQYNLALDEARAWHRQESDRLDR